MNQFVFANNNVPEALRLDTRSQPFPNSSEGSVKVAVAQTFYDTVINNGKDTLVALYAPWCKYCQVLLPQLEDVADMLKNENVSIVKMDATTNEVPPNYDVPSYPTIYWAPKESKFFPRKYEGGRSSEEMLKYIASHASQELKGYTRRGSLKNGVVI